MRDTIKNHRDFLTGRYDPVAKSIYFLVRVKDAKIFGDARYGLIVTKKTFKRATDRNRAKRLLRDWIRFNEKLMKKNFDYIFVARGPILDADRETGREAMRTALGYLRNQ